MWTSLFGACSKFTKLLIRDLAFTNLLIFKPLLYKFLVIPKQTRTDGLIVGAVGCLNVN